MRIFWGRSYSTQLVLASTLVSMCSRVDAIKEVGSGVGIIASMLATTGGAFSATQVVSWWGRLVLPTRNDCLSCVASMSSLCTTSLVLNINNISVLILIPIYPYS